MVARRRVLQGLLHGGLAITLMPGAAAAAWRTVAVTAPGTGPRILTSAQARLAAVVADAILPRTDTPGATDVGVVAWIDAVAADYLSDVQRSALLDGMAAMDDHALSIAGGRLDALPAGLLAGVVTSLDAACGLKSLTSAERGYVLLKELVVFGYFTSEPVQRDILRVPVVPGRFDPSVAVATAPVK